MTLEVHLLIGLSVVLAALLIGFLLGLFFMRTKMVQRSHVSGDGAVSKQSVSYSPLNAISISLINVTVGKDSIARENLLDSIQEDGDDEFIEPTVAPKDGEEESGAV